jgi:hypothetical protein
VVVIILTVLGGLGCGIYTIRDMVLAIIERKRMPSLPSTHV